jgi:uncharacterized protein (DUF2225 family)
MTELEPIYDKKFECMFCGETFESKKVRSRFVKVAKYDTDFFPSYENEEANPILYHIQVCPACGFSFSSDFSTYFPPGTRELVQEKVANRWISHDFSGKRNITQAIQTYKLAVYCSTLKKEKHIIVAGLYMRIAWLCRMLQDTNQEERFLQLAVTEYDDSLYQGDYRGTQISEVRLLYLIAELSRRINDIDKAVQYFSLVISKQRESNETNIIKMAKEGWNQIRGNK